MKILVTGHKGFIGSHFFRTLSQKHHVSGYEWGDKPHGYDFDWIIHVGAVTSTVETDVDLIFRKNYDYTVDLLDHCNRGGVNVQFSSTAAIYGLGNDFTESAAVDPRTPYAWSKYMIERHINSRSWDIQIQCFRYFNVYGSGEDHKGNQASPQHKFREQFEKCGYVEIFQGSENYTRDFVPVEKVCQIQEKFLQIPLSGTWNIGSGKAKSFLDVAKDVTDQIRYIPIPHNLSNSYQKYTCADLTKLCETLIMYENSD